MEKMSFSEYKRWVWIYNGDFECDMRTLKSEYRRNIHPAKAKLTWPSTKKEKLVKISFDIPAVLIKAA